MRNPRWLVVGLVVVLGVPRLLAGPGMMADDWVWVRNGEFLGWWDAGGTRQVGRPGAYGLYALVFGLGGDRPLLHGLVQVCLWACAGLAVHWALGRLVDAQAALVCTAIWLLAPSHLTLEVWASTSQSWVAVIALACGLGSLCDERVMVRRLGWLLLAVSGAFYEVALPVVPIAAAVAGRARTGRWQLRTGAWGAAAALPAAAWSIAAASVYADGLRTTEDRWVQHLAGSLGLGIRVERGFVAAPIVVCAIVVLGVLVRRHRERRATPSEGWALVGFAVAVAATLPGLRSYTIPVGMGDRLTAVSGIGAAVFWFGALRPVVARFSATARTAAISVLVVLSVVLRVDAYAEWFRLEDRTADAAARIADAFGEQENIAVDGPLLADDRFYGLYDGWNTTAAVQVVTQDPERVAQVDIRCFRTGPATDDPLEQYGDRGERRISGCRR